MRGKISQQTILLIILAALRAQRGRKEILHVSIAGLMAQRGRLKVGRGGVSQASMCSFLCVLLASFEQKQQAWVGFEGVGSVSKSRKVLLSGSRETHPPHFRIAVTRCARATLNRETTPKPICPATATKGHSKFLLLSSSSETRTVDSFEKGKRGGVLR